MKLDFTIKGTAPLMMHSLRGMNTFDPLVQELKQLTSKGTKGRTEEIENQIARLEWRINLYERNGKVVLPSNSLLAAITKAAGKSRRKNDVKAGVIATEDSFLLEYPGAKNIEELKEDPTYYDRRPVVINRQRIIRTRPIFQEWSVKGTLEYFPEVINKQSLQDYIKEAGLLVGLLEMRPQLGRFSVQF